MIFLVSFEIKVQTCFFKKKANKRINRFLYKKRLLGFTYKNVITKCIYQMTVELKITLKRF